MTDDSDYHRALAEMERLAEAEPDRASPDGQRLAELAALADEYEAHRDGPVEDDVERR